MEKIVKMLRIISGFSSSLWGDIYDSSCNDKGSMSLDAYSSIISALFTGWFHSLMCISGMEYSSERHRVMISDDLEELHS